MNAKMSSKGTGRTGKNPMQRRVLQHPSATEKPVVVQSAPKPSPVLTDKNEFPSLSESTKGTLSCSSPTRSAFKYSDKLKSQPSSQNQTPVSENVHFKCDPVVTNMYSHLEDKMSEIKFKRLGCRFKAADDSNSNVPKKSSDSSEKECGSLNREKCETNKIRQLQSPRRVVDATKRAKCLPKETSTPDTGNSFSRSDNKTQSAELSSENCEVKDENDESVNKAKKKKKRKSKVKRQVALQSGKITVLTPEVHSKILNQSCTVTNRKYKSVFADINDEEEYPELGKPVLSTSQKENFFKKAISAESKKETIGKSAAEINVASENIVKESTVNIDCEEKMTVERKGKSDNKPKVHSHNPITISFYEMLLEKNLKPKKEVKELKNEADIVNTVGLSLSKSKKHACNPHNLLDSSSPAVKRGKEREKPKPKKPSHLKKIILLDRKARRENLLLMKSNEEANIEKGNKVESNVHLDNENEEGKTTLSNNNLEDELLDVSQSDEDNNQAFHLSTQISDLNLQDKFTDEIKLCNEEQENFDTINNVPSMQKDVNSNVKESTLNAFHSELSKSEKTSSEVPEIAVKNPISSVMSPNVPKSSSSLLNSLISGERSEIPDKEKAAKILLHTRNFREYCNHLISKDIDNAVYALLDDLARFQDRLHQKDPIKARMKRRMIYGVKEVRKHIKLRKLKCIIIAVDIENVETQGGLNDVLNDIKTSAVDHHIPCIFALNRKVLGKVCHKPVPVSCVGVFNFEGSEANFKKMVELQAQSKADYSEIFNKFMNKLTDEEVSALLKAKREAPETLCAVRADVLEDFFLLSETLKAKQESTDSQSSEETE